MKQADILNKYYGKTVSRIVGETLTNQAGVSWERLTVVFSDGASLSVNSFAVGAIESGLSVFECPEEGAVVKLNEISKSVADHIKDAR